jgi:hypothetical protein
MTVMLSRGHSENDSSHLYNIFGSIFGLRDLRSFNTMEKALS